MRLRGCTKVRLSNHYGKVWYSLGAGPQMDSIRPRQEVLILCCPRVLENRSLQNNRAKVAAYGRNPRMFAGSQPEALLQSA